MASTGKAAAASHDLLDLLAYFENLDPQRRSELYHSPWTCLAVFRNLPALPRTYVMRLLYVDMPFPKDYWDSWAKGSSGTSHKDATSRLLRLGMLHHNPGAGGGTYTLHPQFKKQLQLVVSRGPKLLGGGVEGQHAPPPPSEVESWAMQQWEALQLFLLGKDGAAAPRMPYELSTLPMCTPLSVPELLMGAGLAAPEAQGKKSGGTGGRIAVTARGFQFMLQARDRQLWAVLREYVRGLEARSPDLLGPSLSFLLQLGFRRVGQPCAWSSLAPSEQSMAGHMAQLGLLKVYRGANNQLYYTPTRLASSLCGGAGGLGGSALQAGGGGGGAGGAGGVIEASEEGGFIIVESNYRVYAYTSSHVAAATLELFCRREALLPNLFVGSITRDSVLTALSRGITAADLIRYLQQHPHPNIAARNPAVPEVVTDQIRLWEASTQRFKAMPCVLYSNFESPVLFQRTLDHAAKLGCLEWVDASSANPRLAVHENGHEALKVFVQAAKKELGL